MSSVVSRRQLIVVGLVVLSGSYIVAGGFGQPTVNPPVQRDMSNANLVQPVPNGSYLWPYTSRGKTTSRRTLAINLVIHGDDQRVKTVLTEQTTLDWTITEPLPANTTANESTPTRNNSTVRDLPTTTEPPTTAGPLPPPDTTTQPTATATSPRNTTRVKSIEIDKSIQWNDAHGSTRYSYIDTRPRGGTATWTSEAYQIHAGAYFGSRYHIRAYTRPQADWTAIQIHQEYWDWFRLRHTVTDIRDSRHALESEFIGKAYVTDVRREYYGVTGGWNDGWLSEIVLVPAMVLLGGFVSTKTRAELQRDGRLLLGWLRQNVRGIILAAVIAGLYLGVRTAGIMLESVNPALDPRTYLLVLYPTIAAGLPIVAFVFSQPFGATSRFTRLQRIAKRLGPPLDALPALGFTLAGLGWAFVLDFGGLGINTIPVQLTLHRIGLAVALGLIAAGATRVDERGGGLLLIGITGWLVGLGMPLFGYL